MNETKKKKTFSARIKRSQKIIIATIISLIGLALFTNLVLIDNNQQAQASEQTMSVNFGSNGWSRFGANGVSTARYWCEKDGKTLPSYCMSYGITGPSSNDNVNLVLFNDENKNYPMLAAAYYGFGSEHFDKGLWDNYLSENYNPIDNYTGTYLKDEDGSDELNGWTWQWKYYIATHFMICYLYQQAYPEITKTNNVLDTFTAVMGNNPEGSASYEEAKYLHDMCEHMGAAFIEKGFSIKKGSSTSYPTGLVTGYYDPGASLQTMFITVNTFTPTVSTAAVDYTDGTTKNIIASSNAKIKDTVTIDYFNNNTTYKIRWSAYKNGDKNQCIKTNDNSLVSFTTDANGHHDNIDLEISLDLSSTANYPDGTTISIMTEILKEDGTSVITHNSDLSTEAEKVTVWRPIMNTQAGSNSARSDESQYVIIDPETVITDAITFEHIKALTEGTYTLTTNIYKKGTSDPIKTITWKTFNPDTSKIGENGTYTAKLNIPLDTTVEITMPDGSKIKLADGDTLEIEDIITAPDGTVLSKHNDGDHTNTKQSLILRAPSISTTAYDGISVDSADERDKIVIKDTEASVVDYVSYKNLLIGKKYRLTGIIYDQSTGEPFLDASGEKVISKVDFTPNQNDSAGDSTKVKVTFTFDVTNMEIGAGDMNLVVYEYLDRVVTKDDGSESTTRMAKHAEIDSESQAVIVHEPSIETTASDLVDGDDDVVRDSRSVIVDKVLYEGLVPGKTYTITGTLMDKNTGAELLVDGAPVTKTIMFAPDSANGFVTLRFEFDSSALADNSVIVVFESLYRDGKLITVHNDINDEDQSVTITPPEIHTLATDTTDNDNIISGDVDTIINDKVMMTNLVPSFEYSYDGYRILDNGVVMIYNEIPTDMITEYYMTGDDDETLSYERYQARLEYPNVPHGFYILNSANNTYDSCDKDGVVSTSPIQLPVDLFEATLAYEDAVIAGVYGYHVSVDYDTDAKEITVNNDVIVYSADTLPMTVSAGKYSWDEETSAWIQAADSIVGGGSATYDDDIMQQVVSENGERITHYSLNGSLVSKEDGKIIIVGDKEVTSSTSFTVDNAGTVTLDDGTEIPAEAVKGTNDAAENVSDDDSVDGGVGVADTVSLYSVVNVVFEFDSTGVGDGASLVAFEELCSGEKVVAKHEDLSDEDETVVVKQPSIGTKVVSVGGLNSKLIDAPNTSVQVVDTVSYENLVVGRTYSVSGVLMDKDTGSALLDDKGKEVIASATFTADATSGSVEVPFSFSYDLDPGKKAGVVAFETLYRCDDDGKVTDTIVAEHKDWNDADQFLGWNDVAEELVAAGDNVSLLGLMGFLVVSGVLIISRRRHCL